MRAQWALSEEMHEVAVEAFVDARFTFSGLLTNTPRGRFSSSHTCHGRYRRKGCCQGSNRGSQHHDWCRRRGCNRREWRRARRRRAHRRRSHRRRAHYRGTSVCGGSSNGDAVNAARALTHHHPLAGLALVFVLPVLTDTRADAAGPALATTVPMLANARAATILASALLTTMRARHFGYMRRR
jgi:hypothetical protein